MEDAVMTARWSGCFVILTFLATPALIGWVIWAYIRGARIVEKQIEEVRDMPQSTDEQQSGEPRWYRCPSCRVPHFVSDEHCPECRLTMDVTDSPAAEFDLERMMLEVQLAGVKAYRAPLLKQTVHLSDDEMVDITNLIAPHDISVAHLNRLLEQRRAYRQSSQETTQARRLAFALWLVKHGRLSEEEAQ